MALKNGASKRRTLRARNGDIPPNTQGEVGPETPPFPRGASTFSDPLKAPLTGHYYRLPGGTKLPEGVNVVADGVNVNPVSPNPPTHHTIFPTAKMLFDKFVEIFKNLPWEYAGKK